METKPLQELAIAALEELKAKDIRPLDVRDRASFTDIMIIASGSSTRQVRALAQNVASRAKEQGVRPLGIEGESPGEWVLVDLGDVVVHVMTPEIRDFYNLEKLWSVSPETNEGD